MSSTLLQDGVQLLVRLVEGAGALVIFLGAVLAFVRFLDVLARHRGEQHRFVTVRLSLGRYLALGLEFQLAGDVLRTAVAPTLDELAILAAVAGIRTALNFFLLRPTRRVARAGEQLVLSHSRVVLPSASYSNCSVPMDFARWGCAASYRYASSLVSAGGRSVPLIDVTSRTSVARVRL